MKFSYQGEHKYDSPRIDVPHIPGDLLRKWQTVGFTYRLIKTEAPIDLELIRSYYVHQRNDIKYRHFFDTVSGDWITDSLSALNTLTTSDIKSSSKIKVNEIGIYFHSSSGNYYFKSNKYCALVKIRVTRQKGKRFLKKYNYEVDKKEKCLTLLSQMNFCDNDKKLEKNEWDLDINCYQFYQL